MSYNGYENYETWLVSLWLDNEYSTYNYWLERARELLEENDMDVDQGRHELSQSIKHDHVENNPVAEVSVYSDLMGAALSAVNWDEVAKSFIQTAMEELEDE